MAIILLHMFWGVVFFDDCKKQYWWAVGAIVISHLLVSCLTFQNLVSLVPTYVILFLMREGFASQSTLSRQMLLI
ncbi:gamma-secretase subunit Aph-1b-like [Oreochromis aureus]|uniref:gamma-secretase subunit Aph-1b-like n=1 Tax=Oreochromis aureus TaxID=47969 RepID=UPI0019539EAC|nr:gamma-secretase subunit Aph-1b-like [Oreochromis aureus]